jgi:hypothetical protein
MSEIRCLVCGSSKLDPEGYKCGRCGAAIELGRFHVYNSDSSYQLSGSLGAGGGFKASAEDALSLLSMLKPQLLSCCSTRFGASRALASLVALLRIGRSGQDPQPVVCASIDTHLHSMLERSS